MSDALELSVRPVPKPTTTNDPDDDNHSISSLLYRLGRQRGSFRNFTEESIRAELAADASSDDFSKASFTTHVGPDADGDMRIDDLEINGLVKHETGNDEGEMEVEGEVEGQVKSVQEIKERVVRLIDVALNESALALDFTSLMLSKSRESAIGSISPALRDAIPVSSLSSARISRPPRAEVNGNGNSNGNGGVGSGETSGTGIGGGGGSAVEKAVLGFVWQSTRHAIESLTHASRKSEMEYRRSTIFWTQVMQLKESGWPITRLPPTSSPTSTTTGPGVPGSGSGSGVPRIAVRYGSGAAQVFVLQMDESGGIDISKLRDSGSSRLVFSIRRGSVITASEVIDGNHHRRRGPTTTTDNSSTHTHDERLDGKRDREPGEQEDGEREGDVARVSEYLEKARRSARASGKFNALVMESRSLVGYGTTVLDREISIPILPSASLVVTLLESPAFAAASVSKITSERPVNEAVGSSAVSSDDVALIRTARAVLAMGNAAIGASTTKTTATNPITRLLLTFHHSLTISNLTRGLKTLTHSLSRYRWFPTPESPIVSVSSQSSDRNDLVTNLSVEILGTVMQVGIKTTTPTVSSINVTINTRVPDSQIPVMTGSLGIAAGEYKLSTEDVERVLDYIVDHARLAIVRYLLCHAPGMTTRTSDYEVTMSEVAVVVELDRNGRVRFIESGGEKVVDRLEEGVEADTLGALRTVVTCLFGDGGYLPHE